MKNICVRCGATFKVWYEYSLHTHENKCAKKIIPINVSGKTKQQIVAEWEYRHAKHLIY